LLIAVVLCFGPTVKEIEEHRAKKRAAAP
jgi:hypothetical protein